MTSSMIGGLISSEVRNKPLTSVSVVVCDFKDYNGTKVSYWQAWIGVEKAKGAVFGDYSSSFDDLRWYVDTTNDANPGSVLDMEFDVDSKGRHFKRTFLKGRHKGCLLAATAKDDNHGLYLLCFAIVDNESYNNWHWFLSKLLVILTPGRDIVFVTNRHGGKRYGEMCTNVAESFNSWIRDECHLFSTSLVNAVRVKLMEQFSNMREVENKWNCIVCPFVEKKLAEAFNNAKAWIVKKCSDDIYEIQLDHSAMADIGKRSCSCQLWEIDSFPCKHGFCAIKMSGKDLNCFLTMFVVIVIRLCILSSF
ncbi:hypothetical protein ACSBR2_037389 [Camellia fascicularis]